MKTPKDLIVNPKYKGRIPSRDEIIWDMREMITNEEEKTHNSKYSDSEKDAIQANIISLKSCLLDCRKISSVFNKYKKSWYE